MILSCLRFDNASSADDGNYCILCVILLLFLVASSLLGYRAKADSDTNAQSADKFYVGFLSVLAASVLSGLASALSQKSLQV